VSPVRTPLPRIHLGSGSVYKQTHFHPHMLCCPAYAINIVLALSVKDCEGLCLSPVYQTGDVIHKPNSRVTVLSAWPILTFPGSQHHRSWLVPIYTTWSTEAHWHVCVIDWVVVLRPTWHKIGHFGDVLPRQSHSNSCSSHMTYSPSQVHSIIALGWYQFIPLGQQRHTGTCVWLIELWFYVPLGTK